jgi:3-hydroxybutyryl-CoA dehydrogenase
MQIKTVGVLGCGLMGSGIAQVCAASGYQTIVREIDDIALNKGLGRIRTFMDDGVAKGKVTADARDKTLGSLSGTTTFSGLGECGAQEIFRQRMPAHKTIQSVARIVRVQLNDAVEMQRAQFVLENLHFRLGG